MQSILLSLLLSLILTLAVELSIAFLLKIRRGKDLIIIGLANLLTNPLVNYCYYWAICFFTARSVYTILILIALEAAAVFVEFFIYKLLLSFERFGKLKLSLLLNSASFLTGVIVSIIFYFAA